MIRQLRHLYRPCARNFSLGYESPGAFSSWLHRLNSHAPRAWRQIHGMRQTIRNFRKFLPPQNRVFFNP